VWRQRLTKRKRRLYSGRRSGVECNKDCFNCRFEDCVESHPRKRVLTEEQKKRAAEKKKEWCKKNAEKLREYYRERNARPEMKEYRKEYYRKRYQERKEEYRERNAAYRKKQKEKAAQESSF
jgi:hypothetical protein